MRQEMGRVILNMINYALQALNDGNRTEHKSIKISTKKQDQGNIMIAIWDNGPGYPQKSKRSFSNPFLEDANPSQMNQPGPVPLL